jgi:hypothetical protein
VLDRDAQVTTAATGWLSGAPLRWSASRTLFSKPEYIGDVVGHDTRRTHVDDRGSTSKERVKRGHDCLRVGFRETALAGGACVDERKIVGALAIAASAGSVYWSGDGNLFRAAHDGSGTTVQALLAWGRSAGASRGRRRLRVLRRSSLSPTVFAVPKAGAAWVRLVSDSSKPSQLALDSSLLFWSDTAAIQSLTPSDRRKLGAMSNMSPRRATSGTVGSASGTRRQTRRDGGGRRGSLFPDATARGARTLLIPRRDRGPLGPMTHSPGAHVRGPMAPE